MCSADAACTDLMAAVSCWALRTHKPWLPTSSSSMSLSAVTAEVSLFQNTTPSFTLLYHDNVCATLRDSCGVPQPHVLAIHSIAHVQLSSTADACAGYRCTGRTHCMLVLIKTIWPSPTCTTRGRTSGYDFNSATVPCEQSSCIRTGRTSSTACFTNRWSKADIKSTYPLQTM